MENDSEVLKDCKGLLEFDGDYGLEQRERAHDDVMFADVTGAMWKDWDESVFGKRAKLEFNSLEDYLHRIIGDWIENQVGVDFRPDDSATSDADAKIINGLHMADFLNSGGELAVRNAVIELFKAGYGCYKLFTDFVDKGDPENDMQRVLYKTIYNAYQTVIWDSQSKELDKENAKHVFELVPIPNDKEFLEDFIKEKFPDITSTTLTSAYDPTSWNMSYDDNGQGLIYIANKYEVVEKKEKLFIWRDLVDSKILVFTKEEQERKLDQLKAGRFTEFVRERSVTVERVTKTVFSGNQILKEPKMITGNMLPIIPFYGYRSYVKNTEHYRGAVRKHKDPIRLQNMLYSKLAEDASSGDSDTPIVTPKQIRGHENDWANRVNKAYLKINPIKDDNGNTIPTGPVGYLKGQQISGSQAALLQVVPEFLRGITGSVPQDTMNPDASGKAIGKLIQREDANTILLHDNIKIGMRRGAKGYHSMASEIYVEPNRDVNIVTKDGVEKREQLNKTVIDEVSGVEKQINVLSGKKFKVIPEIGPRHETAREKKVETLKGSIDLVSKVPGGEEWLPFLLVEMFENSPGDSDIKKFARRKKLLMGMAEPENEEEAAFLQQAQQPKDDAQKKFLEAAAQKELSEARSLDAGALQKTADAGLKQAKTQETLSGIEMNKIKTITEVREKMRQSLIKNVQQLPLSNGVGV